MLSEVDGGSLGRQRAAEACGLASLDRTFNRVRKREKRSDRTKGAVGGGVVVAIG